MQSVKYADCMRSHDVPNLPDPSPGGSFPLRTSGINFTSPADQSAAKACAKLQPGGAAKPPPITGAQQTAMLAKARCIRKHSVPNFADPTFIAGGEGVDDNLPPTWNPQAPAVERAKQTCAHVGIPIPGVGVG